MTQTTALTEIIQTLADVESRFNITRTESEGFFPEWYADLPEITEVDKAALNLIRRRYLYNLNDEALYHFLKDVIEIKNVKSKTIR